MRRFALLFVLLSVPVSAETAGTTPPTGRPTQVSCEFAGADALARARGESLKDLIGSHKLTMAAVRFHGGSEPEVVISTSSGDADLDRVAADCARIKSKALPKSGDFKFQTVWPDLPFENDAVYPVPPRSKGALHVCLKDYPPRAVREGRYGTTELLFEITAAGTVDWVIVAASSGHADLDQASAHCATAWQYEPAQSAGNPIEVPWDAQVAWALDDSGRAHSPMFRMPVVNCIKDHSDAKERASTLSGGVTVVGYKLVNGEVSETFAVLGSGDTALDAYAFSCVRSWRFKPYYDDGTPATGTHAAIIDWTGRKF